MTEQTVKLAAIGLTDEAQELLAIAVASGLYTIAAAGDERAERAQGCARRYECPAYTDYRQLIVQTKADLLLFGAPVHRVGEFIKLGIQEHFHILQMCPPALNFEQLAVFYRMANKERVRFFTTAWRRFEESFGFVRRFVDEAKDEGNSWHLVSAVCHVPIGELESERRWLYDPQTAGGGVLLQSCYDMIDQLVLCFGMPQKVYALMISQAPDRQQRMSLTEDTAVVTMQFTETLIGQLCASRTLGPARRHVRVHGKLKHLTTAGEEVVIYNNSGILLRQENYPDDERPSKRRMLENIAWGLLGKEGHVLWPEHGFDLNAMAVIEAAYLSARTGMAEEPSRILNLAEKTTAVL
ncbi:MAG: Gfo/Idh/MocA family oxidoreductase [Planctomycetaceae bacterium]|nr:Gfo/Idh/MocA family oxidoreductase [Planctomycetaceae bacterium]